MEKIETWFSNNSNFITDNIPDYSSNPHNDYNCLIFQWRLNSIPNPATDGIELVEAGVIVNTAKNCNYKKESNTVTYELTLDTPGVVKASYLNPSSDSDMLVSIVNFSTKTYKIPLIGRAYAILKDIETEKQQVLYFDSGEDSDFVKQFDDHINSLFIGNYIPEEHKCYQDLLKFREAETKA